MIPELGKLLNGFSALPSLDILAFQGRPIFSDLTREIICCTLCPRLQQYIAKIDKIKIKRFSTDQYWSRPVPSFGDPRAELLIIGLAPAAHGGNRTGRMFTGDSSGSWLIRALYQSKFANIQTSDHRHDGLVLRNAYVTSVVKCAPPNNLPLGLEIEKCSSHLLKEIQILKQVRIILALGQIAFHTYRRFCHLNPVKFRHGKIYPVGNNVTLVASYHPSKQNTNTGRLTWDMWTSVFRTIRTLLRPESEQYIGQSIE
ncbi:MAG TPA: uracil-DNA glycosylase [Nitrososphaeraceae archaeon]|jgi:uracil-DNA glycosylase family 4